MISLARDTIWHQIRFCANELALGGVGRERGEPVAVDVIEPQLRPGVRALAADDDAHPVGPVLVEIEQPGQFRDVRAFPDVAVGVLGRLPHALRDQAEQLRCVLGRGESDRVRDPSFHQWACLLNGG